MNYSLHQRISMTEVTVQLGGRLLACFVTARYGVRVVLRPEFAARMRAELEGDSALG